jgi:hypothetical protein
MKRLKEFKVFGISFNKYTMVEMLHILGSPCNRGIAKREMSGCGKGQGQGSQGNSKSTRKSQQDMMNVNNDSIVKGSAGVVRYKNENKVMNINRKVNPFKAIVNNNKGGYNSYLKNQVLLGSISDLLNEDLSKDSEAKFKNNVLDLLEEGKTYSVLLQVTYVTDGPAKGSSPMKSIIITKNINTYFFYKDLKWL